MGVQLKRALRLAGIQPDEFVPGLATSLHFKDPRKFEWLIKPDLLPQFTPCRRIVILTAIDVTGAGTHPFPRSGIFIHGAALQEDFPGGIKHENMNGAVPQSQTMHLRTRFYLNDLVLRVYNIESLVLNRSGFF